MICANVPIIIICCYIIGEIYKAVFKNKPKLYKLIPIILPIVGGLIGIVIYLTNPEEICDAPNFWQALLIGIISGSSSTGANQIIKQLFKDGEENGKNKMSKYILESYGKEKYMLVVRKHVASFIEKILRCQGLDFRHDIFKQVVYGEIPYKTAFEEKWKCYYDSFMYLALNINNPFSKSLLIRFMSLLNITINEDDLDSIISNAYYLDNEFNIKNLTSFYVEVNKILKELSESDQMLIAWILMNFFLIRHNIPAIRITFLDFNEYKEAFSLYLENPQALEDFIISLLERSKVQTIKFNDELKPLSLNKIKKQFSNDKEWLKEKYKIKNIYLFGSYQKKMARIDSDIDLLIIFDEGNSYERKKEIIDELNEYYKNVFHRFIDIGQLSSLVSDSFIKESNKLIKII